MYHQHSGSIEKLPFGVEKYILCDDEGERDAGLQVGVVKVRHFTIVSAIIFVMK